MSIKKMKYAEWIRLDDAGVLHLDVELPDCGSLLPFLRACNLEFDCTETASRGEEVIFESGTTVDEVHRASGPIRCARSVDNPHAAD